jgi:hypothetical protein
MIQWVYGALQQFKFRYRDINLLGHVDAIMPLRNSTYQLNDGPKTYFYVESIPEPPDLDWRFQYKQGPARLRLKNLGDFNIEIPIIAPELREGFNQLTVEIEDKKGNVEYSEVAFNWDPIPVPLPLDLTDLSLFTHIQDISQVVDGAFDLDPTANVIRSRAPVAPDALLIIGPPHGSQEATYDIRFSEPHKGKYLGLSDFFVGHEAEDPPIGIKPGWSTAGLATVTYGWRPGSPAEVKSIDPKDLAKELTMTHPYGEARAWISYGDNARRKERWLVKTDPPARVPIEEGVKYRVRHQLLFDGGINRVRFRIWSADQSKPAEWLCDINDSGIANTLPKFSRASFALFQHTGMPTEWSNIRVVAL